MGNDQSKSKEAQDILLEVARQSSRVTTRGRAIKNVLCLDGGGMRGLLTIQILKRLEKGTGKKIHELFDYIGGTSTGGIIAILIAKLKLDMDLIERIYLHLGDVVFGCGLAKKLINLCFNGSFYNSTEVNELITDFINASFGNQVKLMDDKITEGIKIGLVASISVTPYQPYLFRNYKTTFNTKTLPDLNKDESLSYALTSTSCAPTYFTPEKLKSGGDKVLLDGGLVANDPSNVVLNDLEESLGITIKDINVFVSIGTGEVPLGTAGGILNVDLKNWITTLTNAESIALEVGRKFKSAGREDRYFRFNPSIAGVSLDNVDKKVLSLLKTIGERCAQSKGDKLGKIQKLIEGGDNLQQTNISNSNNNSNNAQQPNPHFYPQFHQGMHHNYNNNNLNYQQYPPNQFQQQGPYYNNYPHNYQYPPNNGNQFQQQQQQQYHYQSHQ